MAYWRNQLKIKNHMPTINLSLPNILIVIISIIIITFSAIIFSIGKKQDIPTSRWLWKGFILYLCGILLFSLLGMAGIFSNINAFPPRFPIFFIFNFFFLFLLLFHKTSKNPEVPGNIPSHWLIAFQSFRVFLEVVVYRLFLEGITPKEITFQGRSFDLIIGLTAFPISYFVLKGYWKAGIAFNIVGLLSLANIIFIAVFSFPTPFRLYDTNLLPTYFPGILIPLFIAPMAIFFHVLSLKQLLNEKAKLAY